MDAIYIISHEMKMMTRKRKLFMYDIALKKLYKKKNKFMGEDGDRV